ncbi:MAG: secretin N-terminal domain-containing protein [Candidatus Omnitrophica bacterium]|nr:secretin N-terminal domain-containing protein [Candidatus Omnitrophota bacterium]
MMKKNVLLPVFVFFAFFVFFPLCGHAEQELPFDNPEITISMDFQDANLRDVLKIFSIQSELNFIASEAVQNRKVTLFLNKVPIKEAMDKLFKANNLAYDLDKESRIIIVKDWGKPQTETLTKVFYLKHAVLKSSALENEKTNQEIPNSDLTLGSGGTSATSSASSTTSTTSTSQEDSGITSAVKKILTASGTVMEDPRTNSLVVTDIPSKMPVIEQLVSSLDISQPEILLEVEMLDVSKNLMDTLGFDWTTTTSFAIQIATGVKKGINFPFTNDKNTTTSSTSNWSTVFDFIRTQNDVKSLARPKVLTLNNETAEIRITANEAIGIKTTQASTSGGTSEQTIEAERAQTGVQLRITPQVNPETGDITMFLIPSVTDIASTSTFTDSSGKSNVFKNPETRGTKSIVRVRDGDTIILGGLLRTEYSEDDSKLPFFGDLPIAGALFRHKDKTKDKERELLVFITPHIMKDAGRELAQTKQFPIPDREQGTVSGAERFTTISSSLNNFEPKRR